MNTIQTYVFFDLETTGIPRLENNRSKVTEISFVAVKRQHILDPGADAAPRVQNKLTLCLNPQKMIDPEATTTTGLCNELLEYQTPFNKQVFKILNNFLEVLQKPVCLIAHNGLSFDYPILKNHLDKLKVSFNEDLLCADSFHAFYDILNEKDKKNKLNIDTTDQVLISECLIEQKVITEQKVNTEPKVITEQKVISEANTSSSQDVNILQNSPTKSDCTSMQEINETTPKQQIIAHNTTPSKNYSKRPLGKARRRFPWSQGEKPRTSFKLADVYQRLLNKVAINSHRAETDCILMLECSVVLGSLVTVAALWGVTNPFIKRGTRGLRDISSKSRLRQLRDEVTYLLCNWQYIIPWLVNQSGSVLFVFALGRSSLSLSAPLANGLTIVFTALTSSFLGEEKLTIRSILGIILIIFGTIVCYLDKL